MVQTCKDIPFDAWKHRPTFCVGLATESVAKEIGLTNTLGVDSGNAKNLANFIVRTQPKGIKPLLQPCSDIARDTIQAVLSSEGFELKRIVVYQTMAHKDLTKNIAEAFKSAPRVLVFFSPSIVEYIKSTLRGDVSILEKVIIVAIGPVTEQALIDAKIRVDAVSEKPEPTALREAIEKVASADRNKAPSTIT